MFGSVINGYNPTDIFVVSNIKTIAWISSRISSWNEVQGVKITYVDENTMFLNQYNVTKTELEKFFNQSATRFNHKRNTNLEHREFGWWYQQLIKLGCGSALKLKGQYLIWDADLISFEPWPLSTNTDKWYTAAILQKDSKSKDLFKEYADCLNALLGIPAIEPEGGGTFITHHMFFDRSICDEMLVNIEKLNGGRKWFYAILGSVASYKRFSEYLTYMSYMVKYHNDKLMYHEFSKYGFGIRSRCSQDDLKIVDDLLDYAGKSTNTSKSEILKADQITYALTSDFISKYSDIPLTYLQIDHMYSDKKKLIMYSDKKKLIWFQHFHKCMGTSITEMFMLKGAKLPPLHHNGNPYCISLDGVERGEEFFNYNHNKLEMWLEGVMKNGIEFIANEWGFPTVEHMVWNPQVFYFTILRNPLKRFLSNYHCEKWFEPTSIQDWVSTDIYGTGSTNCKIFNAPNFYVRTLCGIKNKHQKLTDKHLQIALNVLRKFDLVLTMENPRLNDIIYQTFGMIPGKHNGAHAQRPVPTDIEKWFTEHNKLDIMLYEEACKLVT